MKKILEIGEDLEKHLLGIFHVALKSSGIEIMQSINAVMSAVKMVPNADEPVKED